MAAAVSYLATAVLVLSMVVLPSAVYAGEESGERTQKLLEIEVKRGDTLYKFADRYLDDPTKWPELLEYNKIPSGNPDLLLPGDKLLVPVALVKDEIADIVYLKNNVRMRRKESSRWKEAGLYERLYPEDGVRTAEKSFAQIKYLKGGRANINENSLVFLRPEKKRDNVIKLEVGELRANDVKVLTASAAIDPEKGSEYTAKVDEAQTTTLSVFRGKVDFISSGQVVTVNEGFMSIAELNQPPSEPMKLPDPPKFKEMKVGSPQKTIKTGVLSASNLIDNIDYSSGGGSSRIDKVHIQLAKDKAFTRMVMDRIMTKANPEKWKENLNDGVYWWRAAFIDTNGVEGNFSEPVSFKVDTQPPELTIDYPRDGEEITKKILAVKGKSEPGIEIFVNESKVKTEDDGSFVAAVNMRFGKNTIILKAIDSHGRITQKSLTVEGKPIEQEKGKQNMFMVIGIVSSVLSIAAIILSVM